jgi:hypothetical protein
MKKKPEPKRTTSFRLSEEALRLLDMLAEKYTQATGGGIRHSRADVLELMIRGQARAEKIDRA